jgi:hypothetical protein
VKVAIVGAGRIDGHPPTRELRRRLASAGNDVAVLPGLGPPTWRTRRRHRADVYQPATRGDVELAHAWATTTDALATAVPAWGLAADRDLAWAAPADPSLSSAPAGPGLPLHLDVNATVAREAARHEGVTIAVVCRWTPVTPGRYLANAMEQAGIRVLRLDALDYTRMPRVDAVLFVESPLPAFEVTGTNPGVPVLFWAHHGEHHTAMQVRLVRRYGADAVLLAHSWHLAHHFPRPVHRLPFGVPTDLVDPSMPWAGRQWDVAFVGSGVDGQGAYGRRGQILRAIMEAVPEERRSLSGGLSPEEMAAVYEQARLVPNDCGTRHRPITMRVFEAVGAGALLYTEDAPGMDRLFDPSAHHVVLGDDPAADVAELLRSPASEARAGEATSHALARHTVRHRVDDLVAVVQATTPGRLAPERPRLAEPLLQPVADDALLDDVLVLGLDPDEEALPDRVVWPEERLDRLADRPLAHAVVVGAGWQGDPGAVARAARRLVVVPMGRSDLVDAVLAHHSDARVAETSAGVLAIDLGTPGYRMQGVA